jgi:hypothetical protein
MALLAQVRLVHTTDPREVIVRDVGPIEDIEVLFQNVLIGKYVRPAGLVTEGGIELPEAAVKDDRFQTKVGLVLKVGHTAFKDDPATGVFFHGFAARPLEWVAYRPSDGLNMQIGRHECRLVADVHIKLRLKHPDAIY